MCFRQFLLVQNISPSGKPDYSTGKNQLHESKCPNLSQEENDESLTLAWNFIRFRDEENSSDSSPIDHVIIPRLPPETTSPKVFPLPPSSLRGKQIQQGLVEKNLGRWNLGLHLHETKKYP